jgi:hypothetical protein
MNLKDVKNWSKDEALMFIHPNGNKETVVILAVRIYNLGEETHVEFDLFGDRSGPMTCTRERVFHI